MCQSIYSYYSCGTRQIFHLPSLHTPASGVFPVFPEAYSLMAGNLLMCHSLWLLHYFYFPTFPTYCFGLNAYFSCYRQTLMSTQGIPRPPSALLTHNSKQLIFPGFDLSSPTHFSQQERHSTICTDVKGECLVLHNLPEAVVQGRNVSHYFLQKLFLLRSVTFWSQILLLVPYSVNDQRFHNSFLMLDEVIGKPSPQG